MRFGVENVGDVRTLDATELATEAGRERGTATRLNA